MDYKDSKIKKVLLTTPPYSSVYKGTIFRMGAYPPSLSLATIAGALILQGHNVRILDLNKHDKTELASLIKSFSPDYVGISFSTSLAEEAYLLAAMVKKIKSDIIVVGGGAHPSAMPRDVLESSEIDVVCIGEGDYSILQVVIGSYDVIYGIAYKDDAGCHIPQKENRCFIEALDDLPFPAWNLFKINEYKSSKFMTRINPVGYIETSRGCPYGCVFCNKKIFGRNFRCKSAKRVVDEMEYMLSCGFREISIIDDCFTFDIERAKTICVEILKRKLIFPWTTANGIRADRVDNELLALMKRAGCYRVAYGIESGDNDILKLVHKGESLEEIKKAVKMSKENGLGVVGYFMIALPGETERTMRRTIDFAKELDLDLAKVSITVPFPGTPFFEELYSNGKIKITNWSKFNALVTPKALYEHPNLSWDIIEAYHRKFYWEFYFRQNFIFKKIMKNLAAGAKNIIGAKWM